MQVRKLLLIIIVSTFSIATHSVSASKIEPQIKIISISSLSSDYEQQLKKVYLNSFETVYKADWTPELASKVEAIYQGYFERFKNSTDMLLVAAENDGIVSGWILFFVEQKNRAVIEIICVDPAYWQRGIGKKLVFSINDLNPEISSIAVVTRKINTVSPFFYEALGFQKSSFMLAEYSKDEMQGYEWQPS